MDFLVVFLEIFLDTKPMPGIRAASSSSGVGGTRAIALMWFIFLV